MIRTLSKLKRLQGLKDSLSRVCIALLISSMSWPAVARDYISVVSSSTVYPFAAVVAERFGKSTPYNTPKIEATGSGGGMKLFCAGIGVKHPDVTNASRRIKASELRRCFQNGVDEVIEVPIGYDGIVLANSIESEQLTLTRRDIFMALAKRVPNPDNPRELIDNPYMYWDQVNRSLPHQKIEVLGPPPTSGTRDAFALLAMEGGCRTLSHIVELESTQPALYKDICHRLREDGAYIEAGENDNLIVQKLVANPNAVGVFGFSFLDQNTNRVQGAIIEGVTPDFESISDKSYSISRPLFFYVKKAHIGIVPGIEGYLEEFTAEKAWGEEGYLADKGMIPLDHKQRLQSAQSIIALRPLSLDDLEESLPHAEGNPSVSLLPLSRR